MKIKPVKRRFTTLEIVLTIVVVIVVAKLFNFNPFSFISKENSLKTRYLKFASLIDSRNFADAYELYSLEAKKIESKNEYVTDMNNKTSGKENVTINAITIKDNVGYVDRTNVICDDVACSSKTTITGYKKWIYENGNWFYTTDDPLCIRDEPYNIPPEFTRAISLIIQRSQQAGATEWSNNVKGVSNCLDIHYANSDSEMGNAEGYFTFTDNQSLDRLEILVSPRYELQDDTVTAILLAHEISHAINYLDRIRLGSKYNCLQDEEMAFNNQNYVFTTLNMQEKNSILARHLDGNSPEASMVWNTFTGLTNQPGKTAEDKINNYLKSNPYYQKECGL